MYHHRPSRPTVVQLKLLLSHLSLGVGCGGACVLGSFLIPFLFQFVYILSFQVNSANI